MVHISPAKGQDSGDFSSIIALAGTMDEFCRTLELGFDRPVVNETNLEAVQ
jgi:hypothetical protein